MSFLGEIKSSIKSFKGDILSSLRSSFNPRNILNNAVSQVVDQLNTPRVTLNDIRPGDIAIDHIALTDINGQRVADLMAYVTEFSIYESIYSPVMFATFIIRDAVGQEEHFRFTGHEMIDLTMFMPPDRKLVNIKMHVMGEPYDRVLTNNNKQAIYKINACSLEAFVNAGPGFIAHEAYDDNVKNVVTKLFNDHIRPRSPDKPFHVEDTKGIVKGDIILSHVFEAINNFKYTAVSKKYPSHLFVFFENKEGFHFTTVEGLMERGRDDVDQERTDKIFYFDAARNEDIAQVKMRNILAYNRLSGNDAGAQLAFGTDLRASGIDMVTANYTTVLQNSNRLASETQRSDTGGGSVNPGDLGQIYGARNPVRKLAVLNDVYRNHEEVLNRITTDQTYAMRLTEQISWIEIYGDLEIKAGDVISIEMTSASSIDNFQGYDNTKDSGNYLVAAVRHMVLMSDRPQHVMSLEILKVGTQEQ